ncbi:uncharacterized protein YdhG (YjbR/CyaY superfamily) [Aurantimicrobium minutum]|uniref:iron chaperone n=1 Tax=Aurantimicrobium minutum TaxID=708131 RepID=UPI002473FF05|nr:DUF1801 domain-containing protein [Aurantimicrobium minutum]MDH6531927.1 uncharacterized protein YdhG (YjbR/CyaY superfamily) [Aurantimicrobium minutum]
MAAFETVEDYLASLPEPKGETLRRVLNSITSAYPEATLKLAWNVPQVQIEGKYVFGVSAAKNHLSLAPWSEAAMASFSERLAPYETTKGLFKVPVDWDVDGELVCDLVAFRLAELGLS